MKSKTVVGCVAVILLAVCQFVDSPRVSANPQDASKAQLGTPAETVLDGTLEVIYEDSQQGSRLKHFLNVGSQRIPLVFPGEAPKMLHGSRVRARGRLRSDNTLMLSANPTMTLGVEAAPMAGGATTNAGSGGMMPMALTSPFTFGPQSTLVILINFQDLATTPYTLASAQNVTFTQVNNFDLENSFNQTSLTGTVAGWFPIAASSTTCDYNTWATLADQAATNAGYNLSTYPRRVYGFPQTNACSWWGLGTVGGGSSFNPSRAWINGTYSLHVVAHEMGHNFGLYHARSNTCDSTGCVVDEYGDDHDVMGGGASAITGHFSAYQKERIGWLNYGSSPSIQTVTSTGQYTLEPYAKPWGGQPKALKILKSSAGGTNTYIYAEARTQFGVDSSLPPGVLIHTGVDTDGTLIYEQDLQPQTTTTDFILSAGQSFTFTDAAPVVTITTLSFDTTGAVLAVTEPCASSLGSSSQSFDAAGGTSTVALDAPAGCEWTATSDSAWLTVNSGSASGTGPSNIQFTVAPNAGSIRTGNLTIGGLTFTVTEDVCGYVVAPVNHAFEWSGGPGTVNVTTAGTCTWTASSNASWLTITGGASGTGSGVVSFSVAAQSSAHTPRNPAATVTVAGQPVTVTQDGFGASLSAPAKGATGVAQLATFTWNNVSASRYILLVGTTFGGSDLVNTGEITATSFTPSTPLPASQLLYARLRTKWNSTTFTATDITFTVIDQLNTVTLLGSQSPNPVTHGGSTQYGAAAASSVKISFTGGGGTCTANLSATGLPSGATATFTPSSVTSSASDQYSLLTVSTTAATAAGSYTFTVRAQENVACGSSLMTTTAPLVVSSSFTPTSLATAAATGTYGGTSNVSTTLTTGGSPLSGKSVSFTLNGSSIGTATTNASGVATLSNVSLTGISAGTYPTGVVASFAGDANYGASSANNSLSVAQKSVTPAVTAANKAYTGTTSATLTSCTVSGFIAGDTVACSGTAAFGTASVGTGKTVTASALTLTGASAANYVLSTTTATTTATITGLTVTPSVTASSKPYDGTTSATLASCTLSGFVAGDAVACTGTAAFSSATVGTGKTVTASGLTLTGADAGNYTLSTTTATTTAAITAAIVTPTITAASKPYDATTAATLTSCTVSGFVAGETVACTGTATFGSATVGAGKTVTANGLTLTGASAGNYALSTTTATTTATITALTVTPAVTASNKPYDGTTSATLASCTVSGFVAGDAVACTGTAAFGSATVGTGKTVTASGLTLTGTDAGNYTLSTTTATTTAAITSATVTPSVAAASKTYDGTTAATLTSCTVSGFVAGDTVACAGTATFGSASVGAGKTVTASGLSLTGASAGNYTLSTTTATTTASITTATVTPAITAANKVYDRTTTATAPCTLSGVVGGDIVTCAGPATFANAAVGAGKTVTASGLTLSGAQASYYTLSTTTATTTASITAATVTPAITAANKTYDRTTTATASCTLSGVVSGDVVTCAGPATFASATVGVGKTVTASGLTLAGAQAGNYTLSTTTATTTAAITAATVTPAITAVNKAYNGTTTATATCTLSGVVSGDVVTCAGPATFASAAVGAGKTVTASGLTLSGAKAGNYTLSTTTATTTAAITAATLTPSITAANKTYDRTTTATATCTLSGVVSGDVVTCAGPATFASAAVGAGQTVTASGLTLAGAQAGNYTLSTTTAITTAAITAVTVTPTVTAPDKPYDGTMSATVSGCSLSNVIVGDAVNCTANIGTGGASRPTVPTLIQHVSTASNYDPLELGNPYFISLPNATGAGNALVIGVSYPFAPGRTVTITDDESNGWMLGATAPNNPSNGQIVSSIYYALNVKAGTQKLTITFDAPLYSFQAAVSEFFNVAIAGALDASSGNAASSAPNVTAGSLTTSYAGDLLYSYASDTHAAGTTTGLAAGSGFTLLSADVFLGNVAQYSVQASPGLANPSVAVSGSADPFNAVAIALRASATAGTAPGPGIRIVHIGHLFQRPGVPIQFPSTGNLLVVNTAFTPYEGDVEGVSSSPSNSWTKPAPPQQMNAPQLWYAAAANTSPDLSMTMTIPVPVSLVMYDIAGASDSPFDVAAGIPLAWQSNVNNADLVALPVITPSAPNELVLSILNNGLGPTTGMVGQGLVLDTITYGGEIDRDSMDNADGYAHYYSPAASPVSFGWHMNSSELPETSEGIAVGFKGVTTAAAVFDTASVGVGKSVTVSGVALSGAASGNYVLSSTTATTTAAITAVTVTPSITAANRPYDGTTTATATCTLSGVISGDVVTCAGPATFASAAVGAGKTVTANGLTLTGASASNYALSTTTATTTATITALAVTPTVTASNKPYDGMMSATLASCTVSGFVAGDVVACTGTATFGSASIGTGKTVTASGLTLTGASAGNYTLSTTTATTTAAINAATVTPVVTAANKSYDATTSATITSCTLTGVIAGDVVACTGTASFASATVGAGKTVTASELTLTGAGAGNYVLSATSATTTAAITAVTVIPTITAASKPYDGTTAATLTGCTLTGLIAGESCEITGVGTFDTASVGAGKTVTVTGLQLTGTVADNYVLSTTTATTTAAITALTVTPSFTAASKPYDGTTSASLTSCMLAGLLPGDIVSCSGTAAFDTASVGAAKTVAASGLTLSGAVAGNYTLSTTSATTTAAITALSVTPAISAASRPYDGTTNATLASCTVSGLVAGDVVACTGTAVFGSASVGTGKTVTASGLTLTGAAAGNYTLSTTTATTTAAITAVSVTPAITASSKPYDGTTSAHLASCTVSGSVAGDVVACTGTATFASTSVGTGNTVTASNLTLTGAAAGNYTLSTTTATTTAAITAATVAPAITAAGKTYDGTTSATLASCTVSGVLGGDTVACTGTASFDTASAGAGKTVTVNDLTLTGASAGNYTLSTTTATTTAAITAINVTPTVVAASKPYDGTATATLTSCTVTGFLAGDVVACTGTAAFGSASVGTGKTVTASGLTLTGAAAGNYTLSTTTATTTAAITAVNVTPAITAAAKPYDGTTSATLTSCTVTGFVAGDVVACTGTAAFGSAGVGTGKTVTTSSLTLTGAAAGNYTLSTTTATTTAAITAATVTPGVVASSKTYDGTTVATLGSCTVTGFAAGDSVACSGTASFDTASVGTGKTVTASGLTLTGADAGNYTLSTTTATTTATINAASVVASVVAASKIYDGTSAATLTSCTVSGFVAGDIVTCTGTASFDTASAGAGKTVTASGLTLTGASAGNYTLSTTAATTTAAITVASVTPVIAAASKPYDGTASASLTSCTITGIVAGDIVTCTGTASFDTASVGTGKTVTASNLALTGSVAGNYALSTTIAETTAAISAATVTPSVVVAGKTYDGTTAATLTSCTVTGVIAGDVVSCTGTAAFGSASAGSGKTVTASALTLTGPAAGNYALSTTTATTTAAITAATLAPSVSAANKIYDGTTAAALTSCSVSGFVAGDTVACAGTAAFGSASVGTGKTVTASGLTLTGAAAGNYTLSTTTATTTAAITAATVTPTIVITPKMYDGTTNATIQSCIVNGVFGADQVTCTGIARFQDASVGSGKPVLVTSLELLGPAAGNYQFADSTSEIQPLISVTTTGTIVPGSATVVLAVATKQYDRSVAASLASCVVAGAVQGDDVGCTGTASFNTPGAGTGKTVTVSNLRLTGTSAGNYSLTSTTAVTTGTINPRTATPLVAAGNKAYDGTTNAIASCTLTGLLAGDIAGCTGSAAFATAGAGTNKAVTVSNLALMGTAAGNYTLPSTTAMTTATIGVRSVTPTIIAASKPYDGTNTATLTSCTLPLQASPANSITVLWDVNPSEEGVQGYLVRVGTTPGIYPDVFNVGNQTSFVYLNAIQGQQYFFAVAAYNAIGIGAYSEVLGTSQSTGVVAGDVVLCTGTPAFDSPSVGSSKSVTVSGIALTGPDAGNYTLTSTTATTTAAISPVNLLPVVTAADKPYDGTTGAALSTCTVTGLAGSDTVTCIGTATFDTADVGTGKTVSVSNLSLTGAAAGNYTLSTITATTTAAITPRTVTPTVVVSNKNYDGTTAATLVSCTVSGVVGNDVVGCTGTAAFEDPGVGIGKIVRVTGLALTGPAAGNYQFNAATSDIQPMTSTTTTAEIDAVSLTVAVTVADKTYDGSTSATLADCSVSGVIGGDIVGCTGTAAFGSAGVGTGKTVFVTGLTLTGETAGDYVLTSSTTTAAAAITARSVTASAIAANKTYDRTTSATLSSCTLNGLIAGDQAICSGTAQFDTAAAGANKSVTVSGLVVTGTSASNYTLAATSAVTTATIQPRPVTAGVTVADKRYDGTTAATIASCTPAGLLGGDAVTCNGSAVFQSAGAGTNIVVTVSQLTLAGAAAANYALTSNTATTSATIMANHAPAIANPGAQAGYQGIAVTLPLTGTDLDSDSLTWTSQALPPGITLNPSTGALSGTPASMGTFTATVSATDGWDTTQVSFSWSFASPIPVAAAPLTPTGSIATTTPTFSWPAVPLVEYYLLSITDASPDSPLQVWYTPAQAGCATGGTCVGAAPRALRAGFVSWQVLTWNHFGYGPWSPAITAIVDLADALVPTPTTSTPSGAIATRTPTYSWTPISNAIWYQLSVTDAFNVVRTFWYTPAQACASSPCAVTPNALVAVGLAKWQVRAWRATGAGAWSGFVSFDAADGLPGKDTLLAPGGSVTTSTPTFTWNALSSASYYLLHVTDRDNVSVERWYRPSEVGCTLGTGICTASPGIVLKAGAATWKVLTWNGAGYGPWSDMLSLLIEIADPSAPAPLTVSPTGSITSTNVSYRWTAVSGALNYRFSIRNNGGAPIYLWYSPVAAGCNAGSQCSVTPSTTLANGTAEWQVQAWTAAGYGPWSPVVALTVNIVAPPAPVLITPSGPAGSRTPSFNWNASANATYYYVRAFDISGQRVDTWLLPSQVGCAAGGVCTLNAGVTLVTGAGSWQVIAWNPTGYSQWSNTMTFTVP